jgi:hypothetical protein
VEGAAKRRNCSRTIDRIQKSASALVEKVRKEQNVR